MNDENVPTTQQCSDSKDYIAYGKGQNDFVCNEINLKEFYVSINPKLEKNNYYYILSRSWYNKWEVSCRNSLSNSIPESIDNTDILDPDNRYLLKNNLQQGRYIYVDENIWNKLHSCCPMANNQLPIKRKAIQAILDSSLTVLELYPCFVRIIHDKDSTIIYYSVFSKQDTLDKLYENSIDFFKFNNNTDVLLWQLDNSSLQLKKVPLSSDSVIAELLNQNEKLSTTVTLFFVITIDGSYPSTNPTHFSVSTTLDPNSISHLKLQSKQDLPSKVNTYSYSQHSKHIPGTVGLQNLGNTCYMNSAIQCLSHAKYLTSYFLENRHLYELNETNPLGANGNLAKAYGSLIKKLWQPTDCHWSSCSPNEMKFTIGSFSTQFSGYSQQDSQELLVTLLDGLHEDLNRVKRKPYLSLEDITEKPVDEGARIAWNAHKARNDSIVVDNFHGQLRSTIQCPTCHNVSITFDPFVCLSLPLPSSNDHKIIVSITPYDINKYVRIYKFKAPVGCSTKTIIDRLKERVPLTHENYFVYHQDSYLIVTLSTFSRLDIDLKTVTKIDLYEFDPSLSDCDCSITTENRFRWALIRHNVSAETNRLFPNSMLTLLPKNFNVKMKKPLDSRTMYYIITNRLKTFFQKSLKVDITAGVSYIEPHLTHEYSGLKKKFDMSVFDREDLFTIHESKHHNYLENSCRLQPDGPISIVVDIVWNEKDNDHLFSEFVPYQTETSSVEVGEFANSWDPITSTSSSNDDYTLKHCLESFLTEETLSYNNSWYCPKCKSNQFASKKFDIYRLPRILIIHLKRFSFNRFMRGKINKYIDFPIDCLDMSPYILKNGSANSNRYKLFAVSRHIGNLNGGHYTAYAKNHINNKWYHFDDSFVSEVKDLNCLAQDAYLLMYELVE